LQEACRRLQPSAVADVLGDVRLLLRLYVPLTLSLSRRGCTDTGSDTGCLLCLGGRGGDASVRCCAAHVLDMCCGHRGSDKKSATSATCSSEHSGVVQLVNQILTKVENFMGRWILNLIKWA
jgi:hypothetical protein